MQQTVTTTTYTTGQSGYTTSNSSYGAPVPLPVSTGTYVRPQKQKQGLGATLMGAVNKLGARAQRAWDVQTDDRFRRYFGFPPQELLYGEFWGQIWNNGNLIPASVYLSSSHLSFLAKNKDRVTRNEQPIKVIIALRDIASVQRAHTLPTHHGPSVIQPVFDPNVQADSLQLHTTDGMMHQLAGFFNFEKFFQMFNYLWRLSGSGNGPASVNASGGYGAQATTYSQAPVGAATGYGATAVAAGPNLTAAGVVTNAQTGGTGNTGSAFAQSQPMNYSSTQQSSYQGGRA